MGSNSNSSGADGDSPHHAIQIWEVNQDRLSLTHQKIAATPGILAAPAGLSSSCIFRVPKSLKDINGGEHYQLSSSCIFRVPKSLKDINGGEHYQPRILSIGPYHHGEPELAMMEEHKRRLLGILLKRTEAKGLKLEDLLKAVQPLESRARDFYAECFQFNPDEFVEMLVVDGCFIIELLRKFGGIVKTDSDDPLFYSFFRRDLIRLENQIPFFILQTLFELTRMPGERPGCSLASLTFRFFGRHILDYKKSEEFIEIYKKEGGHHILDFLRSSLIPLGFAEPEPGKFSGVKDIKDITNLTRAGVSIRAGEAESFLAITFKDGVLEMPRIVLDDFTSSFLLNCVAYEQCYWTTSKHLTTYIMLFNFLINNSRDFKFLTGRNIINNRFGTYAEVAKFLKNMSKDVLWDVDSCYLAGLFDKVNDYSSSWHALVASIMKPYYMYFSAPWSFTGAMAAFVLLVLTMLQTIYTILGYVRGQ